MDRESKILKFPNIRNGIHHSITIKNNKGIVHHNDYQLILKTDQNFSIFIDIPIRMICSVSDTALGKINILDFDKIEESVIEIVNSYINMYELLGIQITDYELVGINDTN